ncbi:MAG: septal ring lytic transglycosylase RlpA family protein [Rhodanobacter sp.]|nr:MAG: septal ring lytic transglycosylase RlpA family protein [Rhodanobacter sp.]
MRSLWRGGALLAAVVLLAACSGGRTRPSTGSTVPVSVQVQGNPAAGSGRGFHDDIRRPQDSRYRDNRDSVPGGPPPDLSKLVEPVPRVEPRSLYGNKSPYTVRGRSYRVLPTARGYDERGIASYYGSKFDGYKTSSLETYDMYKFSAASKTLPLPSFARVTNLENGKSVIVRVNDRGPFHKNRLIDLSYAAAVKIGIWPKGTGLVEVRGIDPRQSGAELAAPIAVTSRHLAIYLQVGAFADQDNAERVAQRLRDADLAPVQVTDAVVDGRRVRRVRVGPLKDAERADRVSDRIVGMGLPRPRVAVD